MNAKQELIDYIKSLTPEQAKKALIFFNQWISEKEKVTDANM